MDSLAHAFQLEKIRRECEDKDVLREVMVLVDECEDKDVLREMVMVLVDVNEKQKAMFRKLIMDLHEPA